MNKIKTIIRKEWAEVFRNRMIVFTLIFLPLLFTAIPLVILGVSGGASTDSLTSEMPAEFLAYCSEGLNGGECFQIYMVNQFLILFMMIPLIIPVNIAAYSIVGEKKSRSLEPLLASPISTLELLIGKNLAAVIPAVLATWAGFVVFIIGALILVDDTLVIKELFNPMWLLAVSLVGPLMSVLSVNFSLMVSSRVNDPRAAEQLSVVVIVPVLGLFFAQVAGLMILNQNIVMIFALVLSFIDVFMIYLAVKFFEREAILTRWK